MKSIITKVKQFLLTPYGKAYLVFITLTKLYLVYKWALNHVKSFSADLFELMGASVIVGESIGTLSFTAICGYFTLTTIINIFRSTPKSVVPS